MTKLASRRWRLLASLLLPLGGCALDSRHVFYDGAGGMDAAGAGGASAGSGGAAGAGTGGAGAGGGGGAGGSGVSRAGLVYWFEGDLGITEGADGITRWADQSGNGADALQTLSASRPKTADFAGRRAVELDGVDDYLVLPTLDADFSAGDSFFAVIEATSEPACEGILEMSNVAEIDDLSFDAQGTRLNYEVVNDSVKLPPGSITAGTPRLVEVVHAPTGTVTLYLDGVAGAVSSSAVPYDVRREQSFIGQSLYANCLTFEGRIAEIILYARSLDDGERQAAEAYLADKWGCCR